MTDPYALALRYCRDGHDPDEVAGRLGLDAAKLRELVFADTYTSDDKPLGTFGTGTALADLQPSDIERCEHGSIRKIQGREHDGCEICHARRQVLGQAPCTPEEMAEAEEILEEAGEVYHCPHTDVKALERASLPCDICKNGAAGYEERFDELYLSREQLADLQRGEPLIDGFLDRHSHFVVAGRDHTYKSFLVLDWLCCLATGKAWQGREVERCNVLYVVGEGAWGLHARVDAWETAWGEKVDPDWLTTRRAPVNLFKQAAAFADLLARIEMHEYDVVVFDTLQRSASGADQNSARDAGIIVEALDRVRQATGGAVGVVAHTDKGDNDTRGSSAFEDDADIVWRTKRDEDSEIVRAELAKRKDGPAGLVLELRPKAVQGTGSLVLESARGLPPATEPKHSHRVLEVLDSSAVGRSGLSATALKDALGVSGKNSVHRALSWLIDQGLVDVDKSGRWPSYRISEAGRDKLVEVAAGELPAAEDVQDAPSIVPNPRLDDELDGELDDDKTAGQRVGR